MDKQLKKELIEMGYETEEGSETRSSILFAKSYFLDKPIVAVEIGVQAGSNAEKIIENLNIKKIYLIDPWVPYYQLWNDEKQNRYDNSGAFDLVKRRFEDFKNVEIIRGLSLKEVEKIKDDSLDYIYLDGDHDYNGIKEDIKAWEPKVKSGGIIAGHDYSGYWLGVKRVVDEWVKEKGIKLFNDDEDWWYVK